MGVFGVGGYSWKNGAQAVFLRPRRVTVRISILVEFVVEFVGCWHQKSKIK